MKISKWTSTKKLAQALNIDPEKALLIKKLIANDILAEDYPDTFPDTDRWIRQCYCKPRDNSYEVIMHAIDELLNTHGVECANTSSGNIFYCNAGDPYSTTILYVSGTDSFLTQANEHGRYYVGDWGYYAELQL